MNKRAHEIGGRGLMVMAVLAAQTACTVERDLSASGYAETMVVADDDVVVADYDGSGMTTAPVAGGRLTGAIGDVAVDSVAQVDGYSDTTGGAYATVYSTVDEAENGAVMTIVDIMGGLDHPLLVAGFSQTFYPEDTGDVEEGELFVTAIGCSGAETGNWDFDQTADSVTVDVVETGDADAPLTFRYTPRFSGPDESVVTGEFGFE